MELGRLLVLTGPTGVGKSKFALKLARELGLSIISIDSMLVYRGMDIGTAKPTVEERDEIEHHLIDIVEASDEYDVATYASAVKNLIASTDKAFLGVGGTPFYLNNLINGCADIPRNPPLQNHLESMPQERLRQWLRRLDGPRAEKIHANDHMRTVRALTIVLSTGRRASSFSAQENRGLKILGLRASREVLHERVERRIDAMFESGLLDEAYRLMTRMEMSRSASAGVGYKELRAYFDGECSLEEARYKMLVNTRQFIRHQMTWFKKMDISWFDVDYENEDKTFDALLETSKSYLAGLRN